MLKILWRSLWRGTAAEPPPPADGATLTDLAGRVNSLARTRLGRSLSIFHVDAGSCNGCDLECQALKSPLYDLERFGLDFVNTPRHGDLLLITGTITAALAGPVRAALEAMPDPKWVIAAGSCACDGSAFAESYALHAIATPEGEQFGAGSVAALMPVDVFIPGCPPSPIRLLEGLLALLEPVHSLRGTTRVIQDGDAVFARTPGAEALPDPVPAEAVPFTDMESFPDGEASPAPRQKLVIEPRQDESEN